MSEKECQQFAEDPQADSKKQSKKPSMGVTIPHNVKGLKAFVDSKTTAEELRKIFVKVFTAEGV